MSPVDIKTWLCLDEAKLRRFVSRTKNAEVWNCPMLVVYQGRITADEFNERLNAPVMRFASPRRVAQWRNMLQKPPEAIRDNWRGEAARKKVVAALQDAGARILLGTDCHNPLVLPGFSIHQELSNLTEAGLTPYEAIRSGTHDAAEFCIALEEWGTVRVGRRADLILLQAIPLNGVRNVSRRVGVMVKGRGRTGAELQSRLTSLVQKRAITFSFSHGRGATRPR